MDLSGKTALVTGACGGIGQAIVEALKAQRATVAGTDRIACAQSDISIVGDLTDPVFCDGLPQEAAQQLEMPGGWVANFS